MLNLTRLGLGLLVGHKIFEFIINVGLYVPLYTSQRLFI